MIYPSDNSELRVLSSEFESVGFGKIMTIGDVNCGAVMKTDFFNEKIVNHSL
jgi:hypothetical protein